VDRIWTLESLNAKKEGRKRSEERGDGRRMI